MQLFRNTLVLDTNFLRKTESLLWVIKQGNNRENELHPYMDVLKNAHRQTAFPYTILHLD